MAAKLILAVLCFLLLAVFLVLLLNVRLRISYSDTSPSHSVDLRVYVGGIRVYPVPSLFHKIKELFTAPKKKGKVVRTDKPKRTAVSCKSDLSDKAGGKKSTSASGNTENCGDTEKRDAVPDTDYAGAYKSDKSENGKGGEKGKSKNENGHKYTKKNKSEADVPEKSGISDYFDIVTGAVKRLPRCFRVRLRRLSYIAGGEDASKVALGYGTAYAVLEGSLALLRTYNGTFYGFRANEKNISVECDFLSGKSSFCAETDICCFVWQLGSFAVRTAIELILRGK